MKRQKFFNYANIILASISITTVKELFAEYAGVNPKRYYSDMRGNEALRLLEEGVEIEEIAERMNYSSPIIFFTVLKSSSACLPDGIADGTGTAERGKNAKNQFPNSGVFLLFGA